jgi:integrase
MPLKLIAPGKRRGNRFWIARGRVRGELVEVSTRTADKETAERIAAELTAKLLESRPAAVAITDEPKTFRLAAGAYCDFRSPPHREIQNINRLIKVIGHRLCVELTQADLVSAARQLYPGAKASSRNRSVITPASYVLHYAAANKWCAEWRIKRFKEAKPETRALRQPDVDRLKEAAWHRCSSHVTTLLDFLFGQGPRITDAIGLTWERLDLTEGMYLARIGKTDEWRWKALHPDVAASLACLPGERTGSVFPWKNRWAFYKALRPALEASGVKFTPHMARHTLGFLLGGASLKTRMDILDHADPKSSMRYDMSQIDEQRAALHVVGKNTAPTKKTNENQ